MGCIIGISSFLTVVVNGADAYFCKKRLLDSVSLELLCIDSSSE
jgi:hypothetical protein